MGVDSGLPDFRGTQGFWRAYPASRQARPLVRGNGQPGVVQREPISGVGIYGHRLNLYRSTIPHAGFSRLLEIGRSQTAWLFRFHLQCGRPVSESRFCTGANRRMPRLHSHFQCAASCTDEIWNADVETVKVDEGRFHALEPLPSMQKLLGARPAQHPDVWRLVVARSPN